MNARVFLVCLCAAAFTADPSIAQDTGLGVSIVSPRNEETIHDNTGRVAVTVAIRNGDALAAGGAIRVLLDGKPFGPDARASSFALEGLERGEHRLQVQLTNAAGAVIATSEVVTFYMWQASALFPSRKK
ncbi:MAG TPA: hypothetical protein VIA19_02810 [Burkholderiales bacterium]|jgi:hypothetical protein